ncbi:MerR family transcriptional regulator [Curtobacterium sp. 1544]|uniref:MerR family transcriptional regulator n=1 Tax=Curtobacterium sp. 1544 TaxID=3156417 RepID=UPI003394253E
MRIGELAARTGASVRALRYYEQQGLLAPQRTAAGQRVYSPQHESAVATIRDLLAAGFCSSVIRALLPALSDPVMSSERLRSTVDAAETRLRSEKHVITQELDRLAELRTQWGLAPHPHVRNESGSHDESHDPEAAPFDHRDRRLRRGGPLLP